jgi:threonine dehydrogenase-like Zn-dependent dehydrogenase
VRAFVLRAPGEGTIEELAAPEAVPGEVVVDVERVGLCGTDVEFFTGEMSYLRDGHARFPLVLGHEWCGRVAAVGEGVDSGWLGQRVTGDTMLGCGRCRRCRSGRQHVCGDRQEIGIRGGRPGALSEQLPVPVRALHRLPDALDAVRGALVEPGGNALRTVRAAAAGPGRRILVCGPGSIGLLAAAFASAEGAEVHLAGMDPASLAFARELGYEHVWPIRDLPDVVFDAVIDATFGAEVPALAVERVEPGGRVVLIGLAGAPSGVDTRGIVLKDVTVTGILSASPGLAGAIDAYASGRVDPTPLVAATVPLEAVGEVLAGWRPPGAGRGPKSHVDPRG